MSKGKLDTNSIVNEIDALVSAIYKAEVNIALTIQTEELKKAARTAVAQLILKRVNEVQK